jgi:hypothetical protein
MIAASLQRRLDDCAIGCGNQFVDQWRRRLATLEMAF